MLDIDGRLNTGSGFSNSCITPGVSDGYESSIIGRGLENRAVKPFVDLRLAMESLQPSNISDVCEERVSSLCRTGAWDFFGVEVRGVGISAGKSGSGMSGGGTGFLDLKNKSLTNVFTVCTLDTRTGCVNRGAGSLDSRAGCLAARAGCFGSGAGCFDAGAGSVDAVAVCLETGAGCLDTGAGCLATGARCLDTVAGCLDTGAGCLDTVAGCLDTGAGCLDTGAGCLDTGGGSLDAGEAPLDTLAYSTTLVIVNSPLCGTAGVLRGGSVRLVPDCCKGTALCSELGSAPSLSYATSTSSFDLISVSAPLCATSAPSFGAVRCSSLELTPRSSKVTSV